MLRVPSLLCVAIWLLGDPLVLRAEAPDLSPSLPFVLLDVNFDSEQIGAPPKRLTKKQLEEQGKDGAALESFPRRSHDAALWLTRTRYLTVEDAACGLSLKPVVLTFEECRQPHYGPQLNFALPNAIAKVGKLYSLTLDVAKNNCAQAGGFSLGEVASVTITEEGAVLLNRCQVGHFTPGVPLHFQFEINAQEKTVTVIIDGNIQGKFTAPWLRPNGVFRGVRLDGLLPGSFARGAGKIAFDNIKLTLTEVL